MIKKKKTGLRVMKSKPMAKIHIGKMSYMALKDTRKKPTGRKTGGGF